MEIKQFSDTAWKMRGFEGFLKLREEASAHMLPEIVIKESISTFSRSEKLLLPFRHTGTTGRESCR